MTKYDYNIHLFMAMVLPWRSYLFIYRHVCTSLLSMLQTLHKTGMLGLQGLADRDPYLCFR